MKTKYYFTSCFIVLQVVLLYGQNNFTISGIVSDSLSGEVLIGATVYCQSKNKGTLTNKFGYYSLHLSSLPANVTFSYLGYHSQDIAVENDNLLEINISLKEGIELQAVEVKANKKTSTKTNEISTINLAVSQIQALPALFGEKDIMMAMQLTPGIQSAGEGKSALLVRGGNSDQNLIMLDDIPLYNVSHFGGFLSTFNSSALNDVTHIKGGFPARYGGRLSSIIDIRMKDGNLNKNEVEGMVGLLFSKLLVSGPYKKEKASYIISFRVNTLPVFKMLYNDVGYFFYDFNYKNRIIINNSNRLYLSLYKGNDNVNTKEKSSFSKMENSVGWGNMGSAIRWNFLASDKLFLNTVLAYSNYSFKIGYFKETTRDMVFQTVENNYVSQVNDLIFKIEPEINLFPDWKLRTGLVNTYHFFNPGSTKYVQEGSYLEKLNKYYENDEINAIESYIFFENDINPVKFIGANIGLHISNYKLIRGENYSSFEPRLLMNIHPFPDFSFKAAYTQIQQNVHLLSFSGTGMPSDYWMPSTANVPPQHSEQIVAGLFLDVLDNKLSFSLESYYKNLDNLVIFRPGESAISVNESWEERIISGGMGYSKGVELLMKKNTGKTTGWIGATISKAEQKFGELNDGEYFPFKYDSKFDFSIVGIHKLSDKISISVTWSYRTGHPISIPIEKYNSFNHDIWVYSDINSFRMRDYHRLDTGLDFTKKTTWGQRTINLSIYNLYNRKNPYYYYFQKETSIVSSNINGAIGSEEVEGDMKLYQRSLFSFFPSFSYSFKF